MPNERRRRKWRPFNINPAVYYTLAVYAHAGTLVVYILIVTIFKTTTPRPSALKTAYLYYIHQRSCCYCCSCLLTTKICIGSYFIIYSWLELWRGAQSNTKYVFLTAIRKVYLYLLLYTG